MGGVCRHHLYSSIPSAVQRICQSYLSLPLEQSLVVLHVAVVVVPDDVRRVRGHKIVALRLGNERLEVADAKIAPLQEPGGGGEVIGIADDSFPLAFRN